MTWSSCSLMRSLPVASKRLRISTVTPALHCPDCWYPRHQKLLQPSEYSCCCNPTRSVKPTCVSTATTTSRCRAFQRVKRLSSLLAIPFTLWQARRSAGALGIGYAVGGASCRRPLNRRTALCGRRGNVITGDNGGEEARGSRFSDARWLAAGWALPQLLSPLLLLVAAGRTAHGKCHCCHQHCIPCNILGLDPPLRGARAAVSAYPTVALLLPLLLLMCGLPRRCRSGLLRRGSTGAPSGRPGGRGWGTWC